MFDCVIGNWAQHLWGTLTCPIEQNPVIRQLGTLGHWKSKVVNPGNGYVDCFSASHRESSYSSIFFITSAWSKDWCRFLQNTKIFHLETLTATTWYSTLVFSKTTSSTEHPNHLNGRILGTFQNHFGKKFYNKKSQGLPKVSRNLQCFNAFLKKISTQKRELLFHKKTRSNLS